MQAKRLKIKRMKRTFPKLYQSNYIPTSGGTDKERMLMAGYKEHARGLAFDSTYMEWLENKFQRFQGKTPKRVEVEAHIRRIENAVPQMLFVKLMENSALRARLFFNSEKSIWIIMEENFKKGTIQTSMTYSSKDNIIYAWRKQKLRWVKFTRSNTGREVPAPPLSAS